MRIVHLLADFKGDLERHPVAKLASCQREMGLNSEVISLKNFLNPYHLKLINILRDKRADIVHTHDPGSLILGLLASKFNRIPCGHTVNVLNYNPFERQILSWNKFLIPAHQEALEYLKKYKNNFSKNINIIRYGIDIASLNNIKKGNVLKEEWGFHRNDFIVGNMGSLVKEEDQETLLKAFKKLTLKAKGINLVIGGSGELRGVLEKKIKEFNLESCVKIIEPVQDSGRYLTDLDILVSAAFKTDHPEIILKAMAAGKAVIVTNIRENREFIEDGVTGLLVPCGFPERLETAIMRLYLNPSLLKHLAENARRYIQANYDIKSVVQAYRMVYERCLKKN